MLQALGITNVPFLYLLLIVVILIIPSLIFGFMRFILYRRLKALQEQSESLISEEDEQGRYDNFIADVEESYKRYEEEEVEEVDGVALLEELYSKEKIPVFGLPFSWVENQTQNFPNVILFLGTWGILLGMASNYYQIWQNSQGNAIALDNLGIGLAFFTGFLAFIMGVLLIVINAIYNTQAPKERIYTSLLIHLENLSESLT